VDGVNYFVYEQLKGTVQGSFVGLVLFAIFVATLIQNSCLHLLIIHFYLELAQQKKLVGKIHGKVTKGYQKMAEVIWTKNK
jgi:cytochrome b subunit of formate dehydrogenase